MAPVHRHREALLGSTKFYSIPQHHLGGGSASRCFFETNLLTTQIWPFLAEVSSSKVL